MYASEKGTGSVAQYCQSVVDLNVTLFLLLQSERVIIPDERQPPAGGVDGECGSGDVPRSHRGQGPFRRQTGYHDETEEQY